VRRCRRRERLLGRSSTAEESPADPPLLHHLHHRQCCRLLAQWRISSAHGVGERTLNCTVVSSIGSPPLAMYQLPPASIGSPSLVCMARTLPSPTNSDTGYRCCRCRLSHPCSATPPPHRPPPAAPVLAPGRSTPTKGSIRPVVTSLRYHPLPPPDRSASSSGWHLTTHSRPRPPRAQRGGVCGRVDKRGREFNGEARARERGGNMCHALFLHRSRAATNNTFRVWVFHWRRVLLLQ
jgi:hypothetical protein